MCRKLEYLVKNRDAIIDQLQREPPPDNVALTADWLLGETHASSNASHAIGTA